MQFTEKYDNRTDSKLDRVYAGVMYDVIWVLALVLNKTMAMISSGDISGTNCENVSGSLVPLEQFNYSNEKVGCLIQWNLQQTNFNGVTVSARHHVHSILCIKLASIILRYNNIGKGAI